MSINISQGGGSGITIETDPTALKIANNLSDIASQEVSRDNLGIGANNSPLFGRVLLQGDGQNPAQVILGNTGGMALSYSPEISSGSWNTYLPAFDVVGSIEFTTNSLLPNNGCGFVANYPILVNGGIVFSDGTLQTTATGGGNASFKIEDYDNYKTYQTSDQVIFTDKIYKFNSYIGAAGYAPDTNPEAWTEISASTDGGGGLSISERLADAFASNVSSCDYWSNGDGTHYFQIGTQVYPSTFMISSVIQSDGNYYIPKLVGDGFEVDIYYGSYQSSIYGYYFSFLTSSATVPSSSYLKIRFSNGGSVYGDSFRFSSYEIV